MLATLKMFYPGAVCLALSLLSSNARHRRRGFDATTCMRLSGGFVDSCLVTAFWELYNSVNVPDCAEFTAAVVASVATYVPEIAVLNVNE